MLYPGSVGDFIADLEVEKKARDDIAGWCKMAGCDGAKAAETLGPDLEKHERAHSEQWTKYSSVGDFVTSYLALSAKSQRYCQDPGDCNRLEVDANPFHGRYWNVKGYDSRGLIFEMPTNDQLVNSGIASESTFLNSLGS
ncbi:hypothetical protein ACFQX7_07490 [Luedemannella flava]